MPAEPRREVAGLIVVGASVGGLAAALAAADRGQRAILFERAREVGGGAAGEPEAVAAAGTRFQRVLGVADAPEILERDILAATRHHVDPGLARALAHESAPLVEWLVDRVGVSIDLARHTPEGHSVPRLHAPLDHGGTSLVAALARAAARQQRVSVRTGYTVEALVRDEAGAVCGVLARTGRRALETIHGPVLLACGGFAAAEDLVRQYAPELADLPYHGFAGATGEGLRLGLEVGAQLRRATGGHVTPFLALPGELLVTPEVAHRGGILVSQLGRRFADETDESMVLARAVRAQPGRLAYLIFDERIARGILDVDPFFARVVLPRTSRHAGTLADLAKQFEIDPATLERTIETYQANLEIGGDPFGREGGRALVPPFYAIRVTAARRRTLGGLAVDGQARVLDANGQPIPGLFATGGAAEGIGGEGTESALAGTTPLAALGLGRLAAAATSPLPDAGG